MTAAHLLALAPWVIFAAGLGALCYRLIFYRMSRRHRRHSR